MGKKVALKCNVSKNGRCGKHFKNTICPAGWCSRWNWCGTSVLHKSTHQVAFDAKKRCAKISKVVVKKVVKKIVLHAKKAAKKIAKAHPKKAKKMVKKAKKSAKKMVKKAKKAAKKVVKKTAKKVVKKAAPKCNVSKNGRCGKSFHNTICPAGWCSRWNWCGTSALHKKTHQVAFDAKKRCAKKSKVVIKKAKKSAKKMVKKNPKCNVSKNGRCGKSFHNTICPAGWCSKWNWCGTSALHKKTHQVAFDAKKACAKKS